jgi:hypothetical protein
MNRYIISQCVRVEGELRVEPFGTPQLVVEAETFADALKLVTDVVMMLDTTDVLTLYISKEVVVAKLCRCAEPQPSLEGCSFCGGTIT